MRTLLAAVLAVTLLPLASSTHDEGSGTPSLGAGVTGYFEFDATAVRPPADVAGTLVLKSQSQAVLINGSVIVNDDTTESPGSSFSGQREILRIDERLGPHSTLRTPLSIPVRGTGTVLVIFRAIGDERVQVNPAELVGVAPITVLLQAPVAGAQLVSVPGSPAQLSVEITAMPGSNLTNLRLTASEASDEVDIGDLPPGQSTTATLTVTADDLTRFRGVDRSVIAPVLQGMVDGVAFDHPLHQTASTGFEPIHPVVYIAAKSAVFAIPPNDAQLGVPTTIELVALNAGTRAVRANGHLELALAAIPRLDAEYRVDERLGPGEVKVVRMEWTPRAAGPWTATVHHDLGREVQTEQILVSGPIAETDLQLPASPLRRGEPATIPVVATALKTIRIDGLQLATARTSAHGLISIDDLLQTQSVQGLTIEPTSPATMDLDVTPKATGSYDLYLIIETPEGPSVHEGGILVVSGQYGGGLAPWSPTLLLAALLGLHVVWRRRWVT